ncbi:hypothetical protein EMIT0P260_10099 [Pseudomonas sp. IT-P260]
MSVFIDISHLIIRLSGVAELPKATILSLHLKHFDKLRSAEKEWTLRICNSRITCGRFR